MAPPAPRGWREHRLFYHADRDLLLRELVAPLAASLLADGEIGHFYFVRYMLQGPHVRLRLRPSRGRAREVSERVRAAAEAFFARQPSAQPMAEEKVRQHNREAIADDPTLSSADDVIHPDNSLRSLAPRFEVDRYGGPALFRASLDFFALSSVWVLRSLAARGELTAGGRLDLATRATLRQAWGLAPTLGHLPAMCAWPVSAFRGALDAFAAHGDVAFERGRDALCARVRAELQALADGVPDDPGDADPPAWLGGAARLLSREIAPLDADRHWRIATSHLHMTANRLGLRNPEEVYLGRMLQRALTAVAEADPTFWRAAAAAHRAHSAAPPPANLRDLTRATLRSFAG